MYTRTVLITLIACGPAPLANNGNPANEALGNTSITASGTWPLDQNNSWTLGTGGKTVQVVAATSTGATVAGLFPTARLVQYQGADLYLLNPSGPVPFVRFSLNPGDKYDAYFDETSCGHYQATFVSDQWHIENALGTFVGVKVFQYQLLAPANAKCAAPPFVGLALVDGVGPVAVDVDGSGFNALLTTAQVQGQAFPPRPRTPTEVSALLNGQLVTLTAAVQVDTIGCTYQRCEAANPCCNVCSERFVAGTVQLDAPSDIEFGCSGTNCHPTATCTPLANDGTSYTLTGRLRVTTDGVQHLDVQLYH